jgi:L-seryl-tRNA(Ser) seleniumtransferase
MGENLLRKLPSVDKLKQTGGAKEFLNRYGDDLFVAGARQVLDAVREEIRSGDISDEKELSVDRILGRIEHCLNEKFTPSLKKAVNATGVILHTGLGRAVLPPDARKAIADVAEGYSTLATDVETGKRSHRDVHLDDLLKELTGAEDATVVNNNAAATMLVLNTLADGKEVIVSRGQLVEIGGSFRMPDVMAASGAILKEVGTTNKTHLKDYLAAVGENSGAIMRVHHSNYRIVGFASEPSIEELVGLAKKLDLYVFDDLGSGALVDLKAYGIEHEPLVQDSIEAGVDVACFSGDKLIGGPQAGIIVGKTSIIAKIRKNPLTRAFRIGKMTIAGMEATLRLFLRPERLAEEHPIYRMLAMELEEIERRTEAMVKVIGAGIGERAGISVIDGGSQVGSGAVPVETIPTRLIQITPKDISAETLGQELRRNSPPIFTRVQKGAVWIDLRTVTEDEEKIICDALLRIIAG